MYFTSFDDVRIAYRDEGQGPAALLLHGYMFTADAMFGPWSAMQAAFGGRMADVRQQAGMSSHVPQPPEETQSGLMARLVRLGVRVIAPDLRGHGLSDKPKSAAAYQDWAMGRDVLALLDHLDLEQVDLIGYSMGSEIALGLLAMAPKRLRSVILGGAGVSISIEGASWSASDWEKYSVDRQTARPPPLPEVRTWKDWTEYAADVLLGLQPPFGVARGYVEVAEAIGFDREVAAAVYRSLGERVAPESLRDVDVPILVLNGKDDVQKIDERGFAQLFANIRFGAVSGDHLTALFDRDFQREVIEFLMPESACNRDTVYSRSIVVDATAPLPPFGVIQLGVGPERLVETYADAGVTLAVFTVVDDFPNSIEQTIKLLGENRRFILSQPERYVLADGAQDVRRAKQEKKLAVSFAFQGTNALLGELALVEVYRRLGVIQMLLAYNIGNLAADGCHESRNAGLSQFGRRLIAEMNRVGMIVDVTHVGRRSSLEALELTTRPAVFSHSTPKKFAPHERNITDEQIRACASKGGIVCLTGLGLFMDPQSQKASPGRIADTIEYVAQLVGPQHAGIGLDYVIDAEAMAHYTRAHPEIYGGGGQYPPDRPIDFAPPATLVDVTEELMRRGYSEFDVRGILGENYLRVLDANQHP